MSQSWSAWGAALLLLLSLVSSNAAWAAPAQTGGQTFPANSEKTSSPVVFPADIPLRRDTPSEEQASGLIVLVALCLLALGGLTWIMVRFKQGKRRGSGNPAESAGLVNFFRQLGKPSTEELRVISTSRLTSRHSVHVVVWLETEYLLGCSEHAVTLLDHRATEHKAPALRQDLP